MRMKMRDGYREIESVMKGLERDHCTLEKVMTPNGITYGGYVSGRGDSHIIVQDKKSVRGVVNTIKREANRRFLLPITISGSGSTVNVTMGGDING